MLCMANFFRPVDAGDTGYDDWPVNIVAASFGLTDGNNAQQSISAYLMIAAIVPVIGGTVHALSTLSQTSQTLEKNDASPVAESALLVVNCVVLAAFLILLCSGNAFQPWT